MPIRRSTQLRPSHAAPEPSYAETEAEPSQAPDEMEISTLLDSLDVSGGVVRVMRRAPMTNKYAYVAEIPVEHFTLESLKATSGGGDYKLTIHNSKGRKVEVVTTSIDSRIKGTMDPSTLTPVQPSSNDSTLQMMLSQAQQAQQAQQAMFMAMMQMQQQSGQQMVQVLTAAITGKPVQAPHSEPVSKLIEVMMPMMLANMKGTSTDLGSQLQHLKALKELVGDGGGKDDKDDGILAKVLEFGAPVLGTLLQSRLGPQPIPPRPAQVQVQPNPQPRQVEAVVIPSGSAMSVEHQQLIEMLRGFVPLLVNAAAQNSEVETYHNMVADILVDSQYDALCSVLEKPNWMTVLFADDPHVQAHRPWFESLRDMFLNAEAYADTETPADPKQETGTAAAGHTVEPQFGGTGISTILVPS
jgi:hypothetical protein